MCCIVLSSTFPAHYTEIQAVCYFQLVDPETIQNPRPRRRKSSTYSVDYDHEMGAIYGFDTPLAGSVLSLTPGKRTNFISALRH